MQKQTLLTAILLTFGLSVAIYVETRPDPELLRFEAVGERAYGYGVTTDRSIGQVKRFIAHNPDVNTLVFKRMPGTKDTIANTALARFIRRKGLSTHLEGDSMIASGAVDLFIAGTRRTMECGARIGVHSWGSKMGYGAKDVKIDWSASMHRGYLRDMGIDPSFYDFTRDAAPPEGIHWMRRSEITRFGLLTEMPSPACTAE